MGDSSTHSLLSPSKRHRWGVCPGSIREEAKYPEPPSGAAALDGTRTHEILEYCIKSKLIGALHLIGTTREDEHGSYIVDADRAARVNLAVEYIRSQVGEHSPIAEQRVFPDGLVMRADMSGTVDCQIPGEKVYEIIDYKDGMSPVSAANNPQLEIYALGALAGLPPESYPKTVKMTIIQPKLAMRGMPPVTSHVVLTKDLLAKVDVVKAEGAATDDPNAPLVPGESQCKYCRAKGACPALAGKVMQEVNVMFNAIPAAITPEVIPAGVLDPAQQAAAQDPTVMSDEQLRQILEAAPLVRQLLEGVEAEVQRRLESGKSVPGFKLVQGRGSRQWALPEEEMVKKLTGMGIPKGTIYETKLVSPAKAEKLVWDKKGETQKLSDIQIKRMKSEYVAQQPGKPTVAPESDPRPAIAINAAPMFAAILPSEPSIVTVDVVINTAPSAAESVPTAIPDWLAVPAWLQ